MALNVAVVGMGNIGNVHAGCYVKDPLAKIVAVCDHQERSTRRGEVWCPAFTA